MSADEKMVIAFAWYRPEQWSLLRALSVDAEILTPTYGEWLSHAMKSVADLEKDGADVRKVDVDVHELAKWCQDRGRLLNGAARSLFAIEKMRS